MPHPKTIQAWLANSDVCGDPGIQEAHLNKLKQIANKFNEGRSKLVCSLVFDEMYIRKQMLWSFEQRKYIGLANTESSNAVQPDLQGKVASQAIAFMIKGLNADLVYPVAYFLINTLTKAQKTDLLQEIVNAVSKTGIQISSITSDGLATNFSTFSLMGANLDLYSPQFQPHFNNDNGEQISIILDPVHMLKLVRNTLAGKGIIYDDQDEQIEWRFFEALYEFSKDNDLRTHKLNKKHIQWGKNKMNTRIAIETFSESCANSMEAMKQMNVAQFENVGATIKFIRIVNSLFDIFNSKSSSHDNVFKNVLSSQNKRIIFDFFKTTIRYFRSLKVEEVRKFKNKTTNIIEEKIVRIPILKSRNSCAFRGFIIDMHSLMSIYEHYVEDTQIMKAIPTYSLLQDVVEMFFGKIRACGGFNNNPNAHQFKGAYRKLLTNIKVDVSDHSNCRHFDHSLPHDISFSNIYFISSRSVHSTDFESVDSVYEKQKEGILEEAARLDELASCDYYKNQASHFTITYMASMIEQKILNCPRFYCDNCKIVFEQNDKIQTYNSSLLRRKPCLSTIHICQTAEKFSKIIDIRQSNHDFDFRAVYCQIFRSIDITSLYCDSSFECDKNHKYHFVKCIVGEYISQKAAYISKQITLDGHKELFRQHLNHMVLFNGL